MFTNYCPICGSNKLEKLKNGVLGQRVCTNCYRAVLPDGFTGDSVYDGYCDYCGRFRRMDGLRCCGCDRVGPRDINILELTPNASPFTVCQEHPNATSIDRILCSTCVWEALKGEE